jgi:putative transposase
MLSHRGPARPPSHERPKELIAHAPNQVWSWDITYLRSRILGMFFYLYLVVDIFSRKIVGWELCDHESSEVAAEMIGRACLAEGVQENQLFIHSDNRGPMKGATMLATLRRLGVLPSFSRPSVSDDNAFSEALFRTLKYRPWYPRKPFSSIEEAEAWVTEFVRWYNTEHLHSGIGFVTPECRHHGEDVLILEKRRRVYELARRQNPSRWTKCTRNWKVAPYVQLNGCSKPTITLPAS